MKKRMLYLVLPIFSLFLESLPYGAVLLLGDGEQVYWEPFSYFDYKLFEFTNSAPMLTAILTSVGFLLLVIYFFTGKENWAVKAKMVLCAGAVISINPLVKAFFLDIRSFSIVGLFISLSLIAEVLFLHFAVDPSSTAQN